MSKGLETYKYLIDLPFVAEEPTTLNRLFHNEMEIIGKELKALEIIKEKKVDTLLLFRCFKLDNLYGHSHFETYNQELYTQNITQEEYDLLKEVLL